MRSHRSIDNWPGTWIAGFTSVGKAPGDHVNHLVYLMKVGKAYASHRDLWNALSPAERSVKGAHNNRLGDVFQPSSPDGDWFDPQSYLPPGKDHSHCKDHLWLKDINDPSHPPLLLGDRAASFSWSRSVVAWPRRKIARHYETHSLSDFMDHLA